MVLDRLPNTLLLVGISYTVILVSAVILGMVSAIRQYPGLTT